MGILNRTPDSFYDRGLTFSLDKLLARAEQFVDEGADILDVGGVKAGPGPEVTEAEELDRVVPAMPSLTATFRRSHLGRHLAGDGGRARLRGGGRARQRHQRLRRPRLPPGGGQKRGRASWPPTSASHRGSVTPSPITTTSWPRWRAFSSNEPRGHEPPGSPSDKVIIDAGLDLGKTAEQSLDPSARLGHLGRARLSGVPVGVQQDVLWGRCSTWRSTSAAPPRWRPPHSVCRWVAGSCAPTTWPGRGRCAGRWRLCWGPR